MKGVIGIREQLQRCVPAKFAAQRLNFTE